ncbi:hypothetical protein ACHAXT_011210 [Thalassiosira profunda]
MARHALGCVALKDGDVKTAVRHWMIAAKAGEDGSLHNIKLAFFNGGQGVTKEEYAAVLRAHQKAKDEMKSEQRERYCASKIGARIPS